MTPSDAAAPLRLGLIGRAHGLGGAFRVVGAADWYTFAPGATLLVDGEPRALLSVAGTQQSPIVEIAGVTTREQAAALLGHPLELRASDAPSPEDDAFWVRDLVGMRARCGERDLGEVTDVLERPANDVLVLRLSDGREHLVPFTREAVPGVDVQGRVLELAEPFAAAAGRLGGRRARDRRLHALPALVRLALRGDGGAARVERAAVAPVPRLSRLLAASARAGGRCAVRRRGGHADARRRRRVRRRGRLCGCELEAARTERRILALDPGGRRFDDGYARELAALRARSRSCAGATRASTRACWSTSRPSR